MSDRLQQSGSDDCMKAAPDRLQEIRARISDSAPITIHGPEPLVRWMEQKDADIAWLLDEVERLRGES